MVNNRILQMLTTIKDDWTDDKIVAQSYADYVSNRISVITAIRNDIMMVASSAEQAFLDKDRNKIKLLSALERSEYDESTTEYLKEIGCTYINQYTDMCIPSDDGKIYSVRNLISSYIHSVQNDLDQITVEDVSHTVSKGFDEVMVGVNDGIGTNIVIIESLSALASDRDASDYLQRLQSNIGAETFRSVSQFAVSAYDCIKGAGKITDKVKALLDPIISVSISKNDATSTIENFADSSLFTGMSPATFWVDSATNGVEKVFQIIFGSMKSSWDVSVAIIKVAVKLVVSIWNKFLRKLFITDDIQVNDSYNCEYLNIPYSTTFIPWESALNVNVDQPKDTFKRMFGADVTNDELKTIFSDGYALEVPFKFGCIRMSKYYYKYDNIDEPVEGILLQSYVTPNSPISGISSFINVNSTLVTTTLNMSLNERFNQLFVDSETETDIKTNQNDRFYWRAFKVSLYRLDFVIGLITNLTSTIPDSDFDFKGWQLPPNWSVFSPTDNSTFNVSAFGLTINLTDGSKQYLSPLVTNLPKGNDDSGAHWGYDRDRSLNSDPSNKDFFNLITNGGSGAVVPVDLAMALYGPIFSVLGVGPWLAMNSLISWIYSTSAAGMMKMYGNGTEIPSSFIPYFHNSETLEFKYTLQSDEENRKAFNRVLTTLVVTVVAVTAGIMITKGLTKMKFRMDTNKMSAEWNYANAVKQGASSEEIDRLYNQYLKATKSSNRFNKLMGLTSDTNLNASLSDLVTNKVNSKLDRIVNLIK